MGDHRRVITSKQKKVIKLIRSTHPDAKIDINFQDRLASQLTAMHEQQVKAAKPNFSLVRLLIGTMGVFALLVPVVIFLQVNNQPDSNDIQSRYSAPTAFAGAVNTVENNDFNGIQVEFSEAVNAQKFDLVEKFLAEEVELSLYTTNCCGSVTKSEVIEELRSQVSQTKFDFAKNQPVLLISSQNDNLTEFEFGVNKDGLVMGYSLDSNFKVSKIMFAQLSQLINDDAETIIAAFKERLGFADFEGVKQLLNESMIIQTQEGINSYSVDEAIDQIRTLVKDQIPYNFESNSELFNSLRRLHPYLENFVLGVGQDDQLVGFKINSENKVAEIVFWKLSNLKQGNISQEQCKTTPTVLDQSKNSNFISEAIPQLNILWERNIEGDEFSNPIVQNKQVIVGDSSTTYIYDLNTGEVKTSIEVGAKKVYLYDSQYAFLQNNGIIVTDQSFKEIMTVKEVGDSEIKSNGVIFDCGSLAYVSGRKDSDSQYLNLRNIKTGQKVWNLRLPTNIVGELAYGDGAIYFMDQAGNVYAVKIQTGEVVWRTQLDAIKSAYLAFSEGILYIGTENGSLYSLSSNNGDMNWRIENNEDYSRSGIAISDRVYVATLNGNIYALDKKSGSLDWEVESEAPLTGLVVVSNNIYVLNGKGEVVVIETSKGDLIQSKKIISVNNDAQLYFIEGKLIIVNPSDKIMTLN